MAKCHVVVAKYDERRQCFVDDGEWLIAASPQVKPSIKVRGTDHFFVGLETGRPSLYGWVEEVEAEVDVNALVERALNSPAKDSLGGSAEAVHDQITLTLKSVKQVSPGKPVVSDFTRKSFKDHTMIQKVHRVFFGKG